VHDIDLDSKRDDGGIRVHGVKGTVRGNVCAFLAGVIIIAEAHHSESGDCVAHVSTHRQLPQSLQDKCLVLSLSIVAVQRARVAFLVMGSGRQIGGH